MSLGFVVSVAYIDETGATWLLSQPLAIWMSFSATAAAAYLLTPMFVDFSGLADGRPALLNRAWSRVPVRLGLLFLGMICSGALFELSFSDFSLFPGDRIILMPCTWTAICFTLRSWQLARRDTFGIAEFHPALPHLIAPTASWFSAFLSVAVFAPEPIPDLWRWIIICGGITSATVPAAVEIWSLRGSMRSLPAFSNAAIEYP
ncbi:hypothetical protein [Glycomyces sp. MUSA5-2]|uniref:hypothetical protein n=1 Tax=Glycomyces sp. MUSA5-2 TaxID=2053002 RepID=UPI003008223E